MVVLCLFFTAVKWSENKYLCLSFVLMTSASAPHSFSSSLYHSNFDHTRSIYSPCWQKKGINCQVWLLGLPVVSHLKCLNAPKGTIEEWNDWEKNTWRGFKYLDQLTSSIKLNTMSHTHLFIFLSVFFRYGNSAKSGNDSQRELAWPGGGCAWGDDRFQGTTLKTKQFQQIVHTADLFVFPSNSVFFITRLVNFMPLVCFCTGAHSHYRYGAFHQTGKSWFSHGVITPKMFKWSDWRSVCWFFTKQRSCPF